MEATEQPTTGIALPLSGDPRPDPLALLIGMLLDQQVR